MPTYQYACTECGHGFEVVQSFADDALTECPQCTGRLRKVFNSVGIVFKGSGFYRNDSREQPAAEKGGDKADGPATDKSGADKSGAEKSGAEKSGADARSGEKVNAAKSDAAKSGGDTGGGRSGTGSGGREGSTSGTGAPKPSPGSSTAGSAA